MNDFNHRTLEAYNQHLAEYIDGTPSEVSGGVKIWIDHALSLLDDDSTILEIGSGTGRDAEYIESKGFSVRRTDAADSFVEYLNASGHEATRLNIVTDEISGKYDMIFADAVFLHLSKDEMLDSLIKINESLNEGGILALTLKEGSGSGWSDAKLNAPRFFQYWRADEITETLEKTGFGIESLVEQELDAKKNIWLHIVATKEDI